MSETYDPSKAQDADAWNAIDEQERIDMIKKYHTESEDHPPAPNPHLHAVFHNIIETQATLDPRVATVLGRLVEEGLSRHNAVHAAANLVQRYIQTALAREEPVDEDAYIEELETLKASDWTH